jgi:hypothetical protein
MWASRLIDQEAAQAVCAEQEMLAFYRVPSIRAVFALPLPSTNLNTLHEHRQLS